MHGLVRELALQVYKTICNNIFKVMIGGKYINLNKITKI